MKKVGLAEYAKIKLKALLKRIAGPLSSVKTNTVHINQKSSGNYSPNINISSSGTNWINGKRYSGNVHIKNGKVLKPGDPEYDDFVKEMDDFQNEMARFSEEMSKIGKDMGVSAKTASDNIRDIFK